jgi:hypothetical protein
LGEGVSKPETPFSLPKNSVPAALLVLCLTCVCAFGQTSQYEVKAAFLLNFVRFVEWPTVPTAQAKDPISICIVGDDPFQGNLDRVVQGESVNGRPLRVRHVAHWQEGCGVLFISNSERDVFRTISQAPPGVLTVGESSGFLNDGGMIRFVIDDRKVRFDISLKNAMVGAVRLSSRLLGAARQVER